MVCLGRSCNVLCVDRNLCIDSTSFGIRSV